MKIKFLKQSRIGDHIWYVTNLKKFKQKYPKWKMLYPLRKIIWEIVREQKKLLNDK